MFQNSILNLFLTCSSFLSSFSFSVFINFFLTQKSKSSTNLNHKEGKQGETAMGQSTTISDSWRNNISCVIYRWDNVPGDKSSKRHSGAIFRGILSGGNYLWGNFPGAIIQGAIICGAISAVDINHPGGNYLWGHFPRGGAIVQRAIFFGAIVRAPLNTFSCLTQNFPQTTFSL